MARPTGKSETRRRPADFYTGFVLGSLVYATLNALSVPKALLESDHTWTILAAGAISAMLYMTRLRIAVWMLGAAAVVLFVVATSTPVFTIAARKLIDDDPLRKADAVVVLGSSTTRERRLDYVSLGRLIEGLRLVRNGWAPRLIRTEVGGPFPKPLGDVTQLNRLCGNPEMHVVGPVFSTRDEAQEVATLAERKGWRSIILVTSPYHSARSAAVFERTGLTVISHPCPEREFSPNKARGARQRLAVLRWWLYEQVRWAYYIARGWV